MSEPLLSVRDISLSFRGIRALDALSFDVIEGEICSLIGPNGAGKSSLLNVINGVNQADSGEVIFAGRRFNSLKPNGAARLGIGRTFQNNALFRRPRNRRRADADRRAHSRRRSQSRLTHS
jgi:branched-chain amino acid transport system ATP-binding protein